VNHKEIIPLLREAEESNYFGSIELKYERGDIVVVKRSETLKPSDIRRDSREDKNDFARR
jgi:hypothetical protein